MNRAHSPRGSSLLVLGALACLALGGAPVAPELGRRSPRVPESPFADTDAPFGRRRGGCVLAILGDSWSEPAPRPEVPTNDRARLGAAEAKRERKRAARLARSAK